MSQYEGMWKELGLNLEAHAGFLGVLSDAYKNIYLSQKMRPKGMEYFDFVISEVHGLRIKEIYDAKEAGRTVVGGFCVYVPEEIVLAVDGVCIGLCAGAEVGSEEAEKYIPRNSCALIKEFMGFKLAGLCPYVELTDLIVGETTCDGKKKIRHESTRHRHRLPLHQGGLGGGWTARLLRPPGDHLRAPGELPADPRGDGGGPGDGDRLREAPPGGPRRHPHRHRDQGVRPRGQGALPRLPDRHRYRRTGHQGNNSR